MTNSVVKRIETSQIIANPNLIHSIAFIIPYYTAFITLLFKN